MRIRPWFALGPLVAAALASAQPGLVPPASRDVTPPGVTPAPEGPFIRVPPPPQPPEPPRWWLLFLPATTDAATFVHDGKTIAVAGVTPPPVTAACRSADGGTWACGRTALHRLRMFLRGRAVECHFRSVVGATEIVAPCRVGSTDLGLWLLAQGWARPGALASEEYRRAAAAARCERRGIWRGEAEASACPP